MPFHDLHEEERRLFTLQHSGQWEQAQAMCETRLAQDPERADCLLRLAHLAHWLDHPEAALDRVRSYRRLRVGMDDARYLEADCLLALGRTADVLRLVEADHTARGCYYRGCAQLARRETRAGLATLWSAFTEDADDVRALSAWAEAACLRSGAWRVRRQLQELRQHYAARPSAQIGIDLLLMRYERRPRVRRWPIPADGLPAQPAAFRPSSDTMNGPRTYGVVCELLLTGKPDAVLAAYAQALTIEPAWRPLLAPLAADMLLAALRPADARRLIEEALRTHPDDYRLHLCHARAFIQLGIGEEARSAAGCALSLADDAEKPAAYLQRAAAHCLLRDWPHALSDLALAVSRLPEARRLLRREPVFAPLARDPRYRILLADQLPPPAPAGLWSRVWQWVLGG